MNDKNPPPAPSGGLTREQLIESLEEAAVLLAEVGVRFKGAKITDSEYTFLEAGKMYMEKTKEARAGCWNLLAATHPGKPEPLGTCDLEGVPHTKKKAPMNHCVNWRLLAPPTPSSEELRDSFDTGVVVGTVGRASLEIWTCKIGECESEALLRDGKYYGADFPMRMAVGAAYREVTGTEPTFLFSGWGGSLDESERAVVENRAPTLNPPESATSDAAQECAARIQRLLSSDPTHAGNASVWWASIGFAKKVAPLIESALAAERKAVIETALRIAASAAETNGEGRPGDIIETEGDVRSFVNGMSEAMRRIFKAIRAITPESVEAELERARGAR